MRECGKYDCPFDFIISTRMCNTSELGDWLGCDFLPGFHTDEITFGFNGDVYSYEEEIGPDPAIYQFDEEITETLLYLST